VELYLDSPICIYGVVLNEMQERRYLFLHFLPHIKHFFSIAKNNLLLLHKEIIIVYCEIHTTVVNILLAKSSILTLK
jgi:hypothetical protein